MLDFAIAQDSVPMAQAFIELGADLIPYLEVGVGYEVSSTGRFCQLAAYYAHEKSLDREAWCTAWKDQKLFGGRRKHKTGELKQYERISAVIEDRPWLTRASSF